MRYIEDLFHEREIGVFHESARVGAFDLSLFPVKAGVKRVTCMRQVKP